MSATRETPYPGEPTDETFLAEVDAGHREFLRRTQRLSGDGLAMALKGRSVASSGKKPTPLEAETISQFLEVQRIQGTITSLTAEAAKTDSVQRLEQIEAQVLSLKIRAAQIEGPDGKEKLAKARLDAVPQMRRKWREEYEQAEAERLAEEELRGARIRARADQIKRGKITKSSAVAKDTVTAATGF